ncbi:MAG: helix-turn-helix domain containing protein [Mycolicibacterium neoaurum]|uniref:TetR/AcrR family transcriptional regulator n=1 Tax=Mycolicibacterium neoaurum TaxID=1795 RepID=UPI002FFBE989
MRRSSGSVGEGRRVRGRPPNPQLQEQRRNAIIESAYAVLTDKGYERTLMSDVARHAHVSNGTLYRYFESKRELVDRIFDYAVTKALKALNVDSVVDEIAATDRNPLELITAFGTRLFALVDEDPAIIRVLTVESSAIDAELRWRVIGLLGMMDAGIAQMFERFVPEGNVDRDVWKLLGRTIVGMAGPGLAMSLAGDGTARKRAEFLSMMRSIAAEGLLSRDNEGAEEPDGA